MPPVAVCTYCDRQDTTDILDFHGPLPDSGPELTSRYVSYVVAIENLCLNPTHVLFSSPTAWGRKMSRIAQLVFIATMLMSSAVASAGPVEDANAAVDRWSAAYNTNDPETVAKNYWPDAIVLGTVSPVMS